MNTAITGQPVTMNAGPPVNTDTDYSHKQHRYFRTCHYAVFKKHFFPFDFLALTSQSIVGESLTEFRPKDEVNTGRVRCIFGENVLKQKNIFITTKKLTLHFSPFNCCISVVL